MSDDRRSTVETPPELVPLYQTIADCPRCALARTRTRTVPGSGPLTARLMLIGEGPGQREDEQGIPFVGRAGQFLDQLLAEIGETRSSVYVTNVVKCRPPGNRDPQAEEIAACADYLQEQIARVDPSVIATLGRFSMALWFPQAKISQIHGQARVIDDRQVIPMYHPAAALRNGSLREVMIADFGKIGELLGDDPTAAVDRQGIPEESTIDDGRGRSVGMEGEPPPDQAAPTQGIIDAPPGLTLEGFMPLPSSAEPEDAGLESQSVFDRGGPLPAQERLF